MTEEKVTDPVKNAPVKQAPKNKESVYSITELLAAGDKIFGVPRECIMAAFKMEKKERMSVSEAKAVVKKFMERKVK